MVKKENLLLSISWSDVLSHLSIDKITYDTSMNVGVYSPLIVCVKQRLVIRCTGLYQLMSRHFSHYNYITVDNVLSKKYLTFYIFPFLTYGNTICIKQPVAKKVASIEP